jgi:hypothetical protein
VSRRLRVALVAACLLAALVLMIPFDGALTRVLGVACLLGFVFGGFFLIADPALLSADDGRRVDRRRDGPTTTRADGTRGKDERWQAS